MPATEKTARKVKVSYMNNKSGNWDACSFTKVWVCETCNTVVMVHTRERQFSGNLISVELPCKCEM